MAYYALKRNAAPGVDGLTWTDYEAELEPRLADLHGRVHRGAYRPQPSRRTYIPKADGRQRPLAIAALEDKIVQGAVVMVLNAIYEEDTRNDRALPKPGVLPSIPMIENEAGAGVWLAPSAGVRLRIKEDKLSCGIGQRSSTTCTVST